LADQGFLENLCNAGSALHDQIVLEGNMETIMKWSLLDTGKEGFDWTKHRESWFSVIATRVQIGATRSSVLLQYGFKWVQREKNVASNFVAKGIRKAS
jgi:hypothetical protein